jgi:hypothetical protein
VRKARISSYDRQILSSELTDTAEWHGYAALRDAAEVPAMSLDALHLHSSFRSSSGPSKLAVWTTCGIVACACVSYIVWSLADHRTVIADGSEAGITLSPREPSEVRLKTPNLVSSDEGTETPLELDNSIETDGLPVINAHLEVPTSAEPLQLRDLPPTQLRQLNHETASRAAASNEGSGAWLTGTIESSFTDSDAEAPILRYVR